MKAALFKLKEKVAVGVVGGSDLKKIQEQLGEKGMYWDFWRITLANNHKLSQDSDMR
jgi:hypothetical protein